MDNYNITTEGDGRAERRGTGGGGHPGGTGRKPVTNPAGGGMN